MVITIGRILIFLMAGLTGLMFACVVAASIFLGKNPLVSGRTNPPNWDDTIAGAVAVNGPMSVFFFWCAVIAYRKLRHSRIKNLNE